MGKEHEPLVVRAWYYIISVILIAIVVVTAFFWLPILWFLIPIAPIILLGLYDVLQKNSNISSVSGRS